ncbi:uncharacterized protein LOC105233153 [Bactrocera dorsalis]|uniref:Uncharacterized protein LOC105233153 n=1 Tax=Bactrocera dorsalis TaxID=27457 RepID=A0AA55DPT8_BACDO|nr:uncharacterized protein LOC105233153 [Bactrocera dorsalis]
MEPIDIDKVLMVLSFLFTTPENQIQLNSRDVNVSSLMRIGGDDNAWQNCNVQEMKNLGYDINAALDYQMKANKRLESIASDLQAVKTRLSTPNPVDCSKGQVGEIHVNLPLSPIPFSVLCVNIQFGDNWFLIAHRKVTNALFRNNPAADSLENGMGEINGEYFIGFHKLRAITESQMYELLIVESDGRNKPWYDHYQTVAFDANNKVKQLGAHRTNRVDNPMSLLAHAEAVNKKLRLYLDPSSEVTIYLRKTSLHDVPLFKEK